MYVRMYVCMYVCAACRSTKGERLMIIYIYIYIYVCMYVCPSCLSAYLCVRLHKEGYKKIGYNPDMPQDPHLVMEQAADGGIHVDTMDSSSSSSSSRPGSSGRQVLLTPTRRTRDRPPIQVEPVTLDKTNILMLGPTG